MKRPFAIALAAAALLSMKPAANADDVVRFATEGAYPPFNERAADGTIIGFEIDLGMELCRRIERECRFVAQDWDGMIPGLLAHKFDGIFASMAITEERRTRIDFSNKYYATGGAFAAPDGTALDLSSSSLDGKVIGTIPGTAKCYLDKAHPDATVRVYETADALFLDLVSGRIDAALADAVAIDFGLLRTESGKDMSFASETLTDAECFGEGVGIGLRQDDDELREQLNEAIRQVRADGTYADIASRYFNYDIYGE